MSDKVLAEIAAERAGDPPSVKVHHGDKRASHGRRRRLIIAGALLVAEVERIDRAEAKGSSHVR